VQKRAWPVNTAILITSRRRTVGCAVGCTRLFVRACVPRVAPQYENYNAPWGLGLGHECCSVDSASFHYVKPNLMPHLNALLYECREHGRK